MLSHLRERFLTTLREQELFSSLVVFVSCFLTARFGYYLFHTANISPAVIWAPPGIALAAVILGGYRMWFPIAAAQLIFGMSVGQAPLVIVASTTAYTLQALLGGYLLEKVRFNPTLSRTRDALFIIAVSLALPALAPAVTNGAAWAAGTLTTSFWVSWSRAWAGGVLGVLVLTPFLITWFTRRMLPIMRRETAETGVALTVLAGAVYIVFWTSFPQVNVFVALYFLFALLFWIGLRLGPRVASISILLVTAFGMAGSIIAHPSAVALNQQLFADELFMILIAPIFLILSALVEERRVAAVQLEHSITELQRALHKLGLEDQSKNEFIATLAHELRNPLAPVVSTLEYLKLEVQTPETHRLIVGAEEQTQIMRRLLDDLLDVARVTQKRFKLQEENLVLQNAINRSVQTVEAFVQSQQHTLSVNMPKEPIWIYGDSVRLTQIFTNILYNAAKYTPHGGRINLEARVEGGDVVVAVSDNGVGIEADRIERIFEPFVHTAPRKSVGTGLGIGLSLTKRLVDMHRGSIEAHSEGKDRGSIFILRFPLTPAPALSSFPPQNAPANSGPYRILVVDDNEAAAHGLEKLLAYKGHEVTSVHNGESALSAVAATQPHVVLLDIGLPDIDGYEVARRLRSHIPTPYIVALTGYGQEDDKNKAAVAGFNSHLTKPVGLAEIEDVLGTLRL